MSFSHKQEQCEIIAGRTAPLDMLKKKKEKRRKVLQGEGNDIDEKLGSNAERVAEKE